MISPSQNLLFNFFSKNLFLHVGVGVADSFLSKSASFIAILSFLRIGIS